MRNVILKNLADELKISVQEILEYFFNLGIKKTEKTLITKDEKKNLLNFFNEKKSSKLEKVILKRNKRSKLNILNINKKNKTIPIKIREYKRNILNNKKNNVLNKNEIIKSENIVDNNKVKIKKKISLNAKVYIKKNNLNNLKKNSNQFVQKKNINRSNNKLNLNYSKSKSFSQKKNNINDSSDQSTNKKRKKDVNSKKNFLYKNKKENTKINEKKNKFIKNNKKRKIFLSKSNSENIQLSKKNKFPYQKKNKKKSVLQQSFRKPAKIVNRDIVINESISVSDLSNKMAVKSELVIKKLNQMGIMVSRNEILDLETSQLIAEEMGHKVDVIHEDKLEKLIIQDGFISQKGIRTRPPIVTIMGHVDHGKTSLLDYIRSTRIVLKEAGGITQHIGAYQVKTKKGKITFLDTPGHAAFTSMRIRGVQTTDIVVLIVAADDGVKPQTIEAIHHAKEAKVPIIVGISKIDKVSGNIENIIKELNKYDIVPEKWGGENIFVKFSSKSGEGVSNLLDSILLQAEILELKTAFEGLANGVVIESRLDKGTGPIASVLIKEGTLRKGDSILCGFEYGRVRAIRNEKGKNIMFAEPSLPVEILGLSGMPVVGEKILVVLEEKKAKELAFQRKLKYRQSRFIKKNKIEIEKMFESIDKNVNFGLNIILKSDVQGSLEAIKNSLIQLPKKNEVQFKIVGEGVGRITETDVSLAATSNSIILGFNVKPDVPAKKMIELESITFLYYSVIYKLINDIKDMIKEQSSPEYKNEIIGSAEVRNMFTLPKFGTIAGCMVTEGLIKRKNSVRIFRNGKVIHHGELESLKRFKNDVNEVRSGMECGIGIKNYHDIRIGDKIETFKKTKVVN
ncbi:translation initiation factor IF-2 [Buchnera aphidicola (Mindarus keteleerifoliae)]|uniref:translation initiation factor IF-2 n=1 Tax=Buchnera aphidicola TaxID=9 RepID=UPI0031B6F3CA